MNDICLMIPIMKAAKDLIATYDRGLSRAEIKTRMLRIADDLEFAADECPPQKQCVRCGKPFDNNDVMHELFVSNKYEMFCGACAKHIRDGLK